MLLSRSLCILLLMGLTSSCGLFKSDSNPSDSDPSRSTPTATPSEADASPSSTDSQSPSPSIAASPAPSGSGESPVPTASTPSASETDTPPIEDADKTLISELKKEIEEKTPIIKDNSGRVNLSRLLEAQKAQRLVSGTFSSDLASLDNRVPAETNTYRFELKNSSPDQTTLVAIAKQPKLPSFSGAAFAVDQNVPISGMCRTQTASTTPPPPPTYQAGKIQCPANSVVADG